MRSSFSPGEIAPKVDTVYQTIGDMTRITLRLDAGTGSGGRWQHLSGRGRTGRPANKSTEDYAVTLLE